MAVLVGTRTASVLRRVLAVAAAAAGVKSQNANSDGEMPILKFVGFCVFFHIIVVRPK